MEYVCFHDGSFLRELGDLEIDLVHSFHVIPREAAHFLSSYSYGDNRIATAIRKANITGVQFHPVKSGGGGMPIMRGNVELATES